MTATEVKNFTIKEFILNQTVSFSEGKEFFREHTVSGSLVREVIDQLVFEIDLPFIDSKKAKSFITEKDYIRLYTMSEASADVEVRSQTRAVLALLEQYKNEESED